jgi:hypothetical protein
MKTFIQGNKTPDPYIRNTVLSFLLSLIFAMMLNTGVSSGQEYDLVTDSIQMFWPASALEKPGYLETVIDPDFGTKITRVVGDVDSLIPVIGGTWKPVARHGYSKKPVWNADESLIFLEKHEGGRNPLFLDGETYEVLFYGGESATEHRWHPTDPDLMVLITDHAVKTWNVRSNVVTELFSSSDYRDFHIGPWEGNLSADGRWVAINANRKSDNKRVGFAVDLANQTKYPDLDLTGITVDWISISATGKYMVLTGYLDGGDDQTQVYDLNGTKVGSLWSEYGRPSHYDLTVDENGDEVAVGVSKSSPDNGRVIKRRLTDGEVTVLTHGGYATHTSTRCLNRPGWAFSSFSHRGPKNWEPYYNEIIAVKLDGTRVERICHIRGLWKDYDNEAQPCPSPSGSRVIFSSDWDSGEQIAQAYVADFRDKHIYGTSDREIEYEPAGIYPNPASGYIMIPEYYLNYRYRIVSMNGQLIREGRVDPAPVDVSGLGAGLYIIELSGKSETRRSVFSVIRNR